MAAERKQSQHSGGDGTFAQRNLRFGWWALLAFLSLGFFLEALHGFKVGWYVSVSRRFGVKCGRSLTPTVPFWH